MATSKRRLIYESVAIALAGIQIAQGYETDMGAGTKLWRATDFADTELPLLNVRDTECTTDQLVGNHHEHRVKFEVIAVSKLISGDNDPGERANKMLADIWKAIGQDRKWGGLALDTNPIKDSTQVEQEKIMLISVKVEFEIKFRTQSYNPYA